MFVRFCYFLLFLLLWKASNAGSSEQSPVKSKIAYGGILASPWTPILSNNSEVNKIVEMAVSSGLCRHDSSVVMDKTGTPVGPVIVDAQKMKLQATFDGRNAAHTTVVDETLDGKPTMQRRPIILGLLYKFSLHWPDEKGTHIHDIEATMDRQRDYHIYKHTYHYRADLDGECLSAGECEETQDVTLQKFFKDRDGKAKGELKVVTYNLWNFNYYDEGEYGSRLEQFGKLCRLSDADILGFQEVRYDHSRRNHWGPSQVHHLELQLEQYQYVFQPAMCFRYEMKNFGQVEEGVAIFSRYPILNHSYILLSRDSKNSEDRHQRICLHAEVKVPQLGSVHVFVSHLSLNEKARSRSVIEIYEFMKTFSGPKILLGDLNAEPHSSSIRFLTGKESLNGVQFEGLFDAWTALHPEPRPGAPGAYGDDEPRDSGLTFSTLEDNLVKRIDYILVSLDGKAQIKAVNLLDDGARFVGVASDHLAVAATLIPTH